MRGLRMFLQVLASLKLTVVLFVLAMFLIFAGTLAQRVDGTFAVMDSFFRSFYTWVDFQLFVPETMLEVPGGFPFPGGFVIVGALLVNLIAAHSVRFKFTRRRAGILMTHAGLILLLASELFTAALATEGNMTIYEGSSSQFIERMRQYELAVIDTSPKDHNDETVIPARILREHLRADRGVISHPALPFDVRVHQWMENSALVPARMASANLADSGLGERFVARAQPTAAGASASQTIDAPSAYVTLTTESETLGTYLVTTIDNASHTMPHHPQDVQVDGKTYKLDLRFERAYKPYTLHLKDFQHEKFPGTDKPRAFKSKIRLVDPERNTDRQVLISMNNPLYYRGETFYQSAFKPDNSGTVLQVVNNPAWYLPYVACSLIALGLVVHFAASLGRFLRRQVA